MMKRFALLPLLAAVVPAAVVVLLAQSPTAASFTEDHAGRLHVSRARPLPRRLVGVRHRRPRGAAEVAPLHLLRRRPLRRSLEDHQQRHHLPARLRRAGRHRHRLPGDRPVEREHRLGRHRRCLERARGLPGRRRLQVDRRGQDLAAHGASGDPAHRPHRRPSDQPRHRLRGRDGAAVVDERRARRLQDDRRRQDLDEGALRQRADRRHRPRRSTAGIPTRCTPRCTTCSGGRGSSSKAARAAASSRRPTAARPGRS